MYQPWGDPAADAIIKLIEERERKEVKYSSYENDSGNWNIVSYKQFGDCNDVERPKHQIELDSSAGQVRRGPGHVDLKARHPWDHAPAASSRAALAPAASWGSKIADSINKQLQKTEIDVALTVRKQSNDSEELAELRPRRRHASPQKYEKRSRSRSRSISRDRKPRRRSRSNPKTTKRRSRSRSASRDRKRKRSVSRDRKRGRSDRYRSRSRSSERKRDTRSPRRRSPTPKAQDKPAKTTTEMLSKFVSMMQEVKKEQPAPVQTAPNSNVLPEFDSSNMGHTIIPWLLRVDDVAKLFGWGDKETIQYALPKLVGDARTWYQTLENVPCTWAEWRKKLKAQFPGPSYSRVFMDMFDRHALPTETLEKYYYDKMLLVNRCGLKGRYAVDCILQGVKLESIRLCAEAADFAEPEELLKYFKSVETVWLENKKAKSIKATEHKLPVKKVPKMPQINCFRCGNEGHRADVCWTKLENSNADTSPDQPEKSVKCYRCGKDGHKAYACLLKKGNSKADTINPDQPKPHKAIAICSFCGISGHKASACWSKRGNLDVNIQNVDQPKNITTCFLCGQNGHKAHTCSKQVIINADAPNPEETIRPPNAQQNFEPPQFQPHQRFTNPQMFKPVQPFQAQHPKQPNQRNLLAGQQKKQKVCFQCGTVGHLRNRCQQTKMKKDRQNDTVGPSDACISVPFDTTSDILPSSPAGNFNEPAEPAPPGVE